MRQPSPSDRVRADVTWDETGTPIARAFDDPYFSRLDGRAETRHVFLCLNGLPRRWAGRASFTIAELGFGTGLNFFETLATWRYADRPDAAQLIYVAFEKSPLTATDLERAIARWPDLAADCAHLLEAWPPYPGWGEIDFGDGAVLSLGVGDANDLVPAWRAQADAWYLDGFSPAKNPDMWGADLMRAVCAHTSDGGTFATYTAAGWVRRNLLAAGFTVEKAPGYGRKRDSLRGVKGTSVSASGS
jgi:tRNA U34 5-methylaminomethyl-2-thiouridine-forming methyltransferase MnmC